MKAKLIRMTKIMLESGRVEKRFPVDVPLRIASLDRPWLVEQAITENVSVFGARILTKDLWRPNEKVTVESPGDPTPCQARIVYLQRLVAGKIAIGLRLERARRDWLSGSGQMG